MGQFGSFAQHCCFVGSQKLDLPGKLAPLGKENLVCARKPNRLFRTGKRHSFVFILSALVSHATRAGKIKVSAVMCVLIQSQLLHIMNGWLGADGPPKLAARIKLLRAGFVSSLYTTRASLYMG